MNVRLTREQKIKLLNSQDVFHIMQQVLMRENKIRRNKEHFWIICLASNNQILLIELISLGSVDPTIVEPMDVFSFALQKRAVKIIMVHNHPSGELKPSRADKAITDKMQAIGKFLRTPVIDHLIISETGYYSFADTGLLHEIESKSQYDLTFKQIDKLKAEMEQAKKKKAAEMAKRALEEGLSIEQVVKITGLTKKQIEKLQR